MSLGASSGYCDSAPSGSAKLRLFWKPAPKRLRVPSVPLAASKRLSGAKKESLKTEESCQRLPRLERRGVLLLIDGRFGGWLLGPGVGAGCGPRALVLLNGTSSCSSAALGRLSIGQRR